MRFVYVPGWVPVQVTDRPVVEFSFGDAVVDRWSTVDESGATRPSGEVDLFDWDGHRAFTLRASTAAIDLSAATLHVRTVAAT